MATLKFPAPKITGLYIRNIGPIETMDIPFGECSFLVFFGLCQAGKSTILQSVTLPFGGAFPQGILRDGTNEGSVELTFSNGSVRREFYRSNVDGSVKARDIKLMLAEYGASPVPRPVEVMRAWLSDLLQDQDHVRDMNEPERQRWFVRLLQIDTGEEDAEITQLKDQQAHLTTKIASFGTIDLTPVEQINVAALRAELKTTRDMHASKVKGWQTELEQLRKDHAGRVAGWQMELDNLRNEYAGGKRKELADAELELTDARGKIVTCLKTIDHFEAQLLAAKEQLAAHQMTASEGILKVEALKKEVTELPDLTAKANEIKAKIQAPLDTAELEAKISKALDTAALEQRINDGVRNEVLFAAFQERVAKDEERKQAVELLEYDKSRVKELEKAKAAKLAEAAAKSGIPNLEFDAEGNFIFEKTTAGMLSDSQMDRFTLELRKLFPDSIRLALLDRGESMDLRTAKNIMVEVERAKKNNLTTLVTVVGDSIPTDIPEEVGVFLVEKGTLKRQ